MSLQVRPRQTAAHWSAEMRCLRIGRTSSWGYGGRTWAKSVSRGNEIEVLRSMTSSMRIEVLTLGDVRSMNGVRHVTRDRGVG